MTLPTTEFHFELRTCRWVEREWPRDPATAVLVARQLGTRRRRWDTIVLECDSDALEQRARFGRSRLDSDLLHVIENAPATWTYYRDALPHPSYPWRYVREAIHEADDRDILETRKRRNRIEIRRRWRYPDWCRRLIAIENKPDLDASAARTLCAQLEYDVALALADEVWVGTKRTDERIEPILLEGLPVEVGVLVLEPDRLEAETVWHPRTLAVEQPGTRILERPSERTYDASAARFEYVDPTTKERLRRVIAERAYERGWRSFVETMRPDCRYFELRARDPDTDRSYDQLLPWCRAHERCQRAGECSSRCAHLEPEPPHWRTRGWPIEGGPGKRYRTLLRERRRRHR